MRLETKKIETKLNSYFNHLSEKNKLVLLNVAEALANDETNYQFTDKEFEEFENRWNSYKSGTEKTFSLADVKKNIRKKLKVIKH